MLTVPDPLPVHPAFLVPKMPRRGLRVVTPFPTRQSPTDVPPALGAHPRLLLERPCAACDYRTASCLYAEGQTFMGNVVELFEYACPACGAFTTYKLWV